MASSQSQYMLACESALSNSVLRSLAHAIKNRVDDFVKLGEDEMIAEFHRVLQLSPPVRQSTTANGFAMPGQAPSNPFGSMPGQAPSSGFASSQPFQGGMPPAIMGGAFPPAPGLLATIPGAPTTKRGGGKSKPEPVWSSPQRYLQLRGAGHMICAYAPNRGKDKGNVCCAQPVCNPENSNEPSKLRCESHVKNIGVIDSLVSGAGTTGVVPPQFTGYNAPPSNLSSFPTPPHAVSTQKEAGLVVGLFDGLPESYMVGTLDSKTGTGLIPGWLIYNNSNGPLLVVGKFPNSPPEKYAFQAGWEGYLEPLDMNEQMKAKNNKFYYSYKAGLTGGISIEQSTQEAIMAQQAAAGFPAPPTHSGFPAPPTHSGFPAPPSHVNQMPPMPTGFPAPPTHVNQMPPMPTGFPAPPSKSGFPAPPTHVNQMPPMPTGFPAPPSHINQMPPVPVVTAGFPAPPSHINQMPPVPVVTAGFPNISQMPPVPTGFPNISQMPPVSTGFPNISQMPPVPAVATEMNLDRVEAAGVSTPDVPESTSQETIETVIGVTA